MWMRWSTALVKGKGEHEICDFEFKFENQSKLGLDIIGILSQLIGRVKTHHFVYEWFRVTLDKNWLVIGITRATSFKETLVAYWAETFRSTDHAIQSDLRCCYRPRNDVIASISRDVTLYTMMNLNQNVT